MGFGGVYRLRGVDGVRSQPIQAEVTVEGGLSGDRWSRGERFLESRYP